MPTGGEVVGVERLDLHGCRIEDVRERVDKFVDVHIVNGGRVEILCGKGTGAVMREVRTYLNELRRGKGAYSIDSYVEREAAFLVDLG